MIWTKLVKYTHEVIKVVHCGSTNKILSSFLGLYFSDMMGGQPIREANRLEATNNSDGRRWRLNSRCFIYVLTSGPSEKLGCSLESNTPSSCARASAELTSIHDIRSDRRVGSMTSCSQRSCIGISSVIAGGSRSLGVVYIKSESHPSVSGGKCKARGYHSVRRRSASIVPRCLVFALETFSCPRVIRNMRCWQCCHNLWWMMNPLDVPKGPGTIWYRAEIIKMVQHSIGSWVISQ